MRNVFKHEEDMCEESHSEPQIYYFSLFPSLIRFLAYLKWWPRYVFSNKDCSSIVYEMIEDRCERKCLEGNLHIMICFRRLKIKAWRLPPTCVNLMKALLAGIIVVCLWHGIILCKMVGC